MAFVGVESIVFCRIASTALCAVTLVLTAGCSGETPPPVGALSGAVTLDGNPVNEGTINFIQESGFAASADIKNGKYTMANSQHGTGIPTGEYKVSIAPIVKMQADPLSGDAGAGPTDESAIPKKYGDPATSGLTAKVVEGTTNLDFPLTTK
jgi:hypothetical protein